MTDSEFWIKGKRVLLSEKNGPEPASVFVSHGKIQILEQGPAREDRPYELDAGDSILMPGVVDTHAHLNEPGRTEWEGFETATQAAAAGGITTVVDMPLNCVPATTTLDALKEKQGVAQEKAMVDLGFWGGVVPGNESELAPMIDAGVCGFKCFLSESGVAEFKRISLDELPKAMLILAAHEVPLLVHAELEPPTALQPSEDPCDYSTYLQSRPDSFEVEAIRSMIHLAKKTKCHVHIVHLSTAHALSLIGEARLEGVPISVETCPHYLSLDAESISKGNTQFKCAPPIRSKENQQDLWQGLTESVIDMIVSDHSPCTPQLKKLETGDFMSAWGGISGLQLTLPIIWTEMKLRSLNPSPLLRWLCASPAKLAGLSDRKGSIEVSKDADFVIWNPDAEFKVDESYPLFHRHPVTPYRGRRLWGEVEKTLLRGQVIFDKEQSLTSRVGHLLTRH